MREEILKLRTEGKSYREIQKILNCSKATINYYCNPEGKSKVRERQKTMRINNPLIQKVEAFKHRLKSKTEKFQHRKKNNGDGRIEEFDSNLMDFSWQDIYKLIEANPHCYLTGVKLDLNDIGGISLDHKLPVSKGGDNSLENLGICSKRANSSKFDMTVDEYIEHCKKVLLNFGFSVTKNGS